MPVDETVRIAMGVEYDGDAFHGWQIQDNRRTVQGALERAVGGVADHRVRVHCAGRTDAGVHAIEQVIHFDTRARRSERSWVLGTNVNLPPDVNVLWAGPVSPEFHARFRAIARHYLYRILVRPTRPSLLRNRVVWVHRALDLDAMRRAAPALVGEHDFTSFRALGCQAKSPVRRMHYLALERRGELIELRIGADGFLHHMVRNIAGVLMAIGQGDRPASWVGELLRLRDRRQGGVTAPPQGLYFLRADYPEGLDPPPRPAWTRDRGHRPA
ncbi:MAG: tRNA pseudouridine(38-40) synthase TruA [Candidatus Thiosymbion ectosymbiont of Robbea hypermnestra]|nr:tRNA pseudouridine(38-40) synthase TruA [Candidatus Thiosymbion ectosymbiont of Robbea hypermnestra]